MTIRATVVGLDGVEELRKSLDLAVELQSLGFDVEITGDVYITARQNVEIQDPNDPEGEP